MLDQSSPRTVDAGTILEDRIESNSTMENRSLSELAGRVERLEKQGRRWKLAGIMAMLTLAASVVACGVARDELPKLIRAGAFVVVNDVGREVVRIGTDPHEKGQGLVEVLDQSGKPRIKMGLTALDHTFQVLIGKNPNDQLVLDAIPEGGVGIKLKDLEHSTGILMTTSREGIVAIGCIASARAASSLSTWARASIPTQRRDSSSETRTARN